MFETHIYNIVFIILLVLWRLGMVLQASADEQTVPPSNWPQILELSQHVGFSCVCSHYVK